jgi:uncharacterized protein
MDPLDPVSVRVLGSLIEKEFTTPDTYPLTLNALTAACNQTTNREPVMSLDEGTVSKSIDDLTRRSFVREVHRSDSRAKRWRQTFSEKLSLHQAETAAMCVLMLRGPQTTGEIKTRAVRLFNFNDLAQVDITLRALMDLTTPLVVELPRQPGQKEVRFAHLLSGEPDLTAIPQSEPAPAKSNRIDALEAEIAALRSEMAELKARFDEFRREFH